MKERVKRKRQEQVNEKTMTAEQFGSQRRQTEMTRKLLYRQRRHMKQGQPMYRWQHQVSVFSCHKICENSLTLRGDVLSFATEATAGLAMTGLRSGAFVMRCSNSSHRCAVRDWSDGDAE